MLNRKVKLLIFGMMVLVQLYIPAKMIWDAETTILEGVEYKFELRPRDPVDYFRGKYITLRFMENSFNNTGASLGFKKNDEVYVELRLGADGFAQINGLHSIDNPPIGTDYFKAKVKSVNDNNTDEIENERIHIHIPFDRFYMEESKARPAEDLSREMLRDTTNKAYGKVMIKDGNAVLDNVYINELRITDLLEVEN